MKKQRSDQNFIPFLVKLSPIDKHILDEMSSDLGIYQSDLMRLALWNYVNVPKDGLLKITLKELAHTREVSFTMDILKELERTNSRKVFFIDGFRTMLEAYHTKYAPIDGVRMYVKLKLIALYSLFKESKERKDYVEYIRKHYLHYYSNDRAWLEDQINLVRSLKKDEKDKLLVNLQRESPSAKFKETPAIDFTEHLNQDGDVDVNVLERLPAAKQKAIKEHLNKEKIKSEVRGQFYADKDKYFKKGDLKNA